MKTPDISVLVCTYDRQEMLRRALDSLIHQKTNGDFTYEIVIVDDGSTDGTRDAVKEIASCSPVPVRYFYQQGNGVPSARNKCVREAQGDWIAFFDDDQVAEPDWLKELLALASKTGAYCVRGSRLLGLSEQQLSRLSPTCRTILGEEVFGNEPIKCHRKALPNTGNVLIRRAIFDAVGYFDESLADGCDDNDFFQRFLIAGFEAWSAPRAVVHHFIPQYRLTLQYFRWSSTRLGNNFAYIDYKQWGKGKIVFLCIARIGQALFINLPRLLLACVLGDKAEVVGQECLLWRCMAYARKTLFLIAPEIVIQDRSFAQLEFRGERKMYAQTEPLSPKEGD